MIVTYSIGWLFAGFAALNIFIAALLFAMPVLVTWSAVEINIGSKRFAYGYGGWVVQDREYRTLATGYWPWYPPKERAPNG